MRTTKLFAVLTISACAMPVSGALVMLAIIYRSHLLLIVPVVISVISITLGLWSLRGIEKNLRTSSVSITATVAGSKVLRPMFYEEEYGHASVTSGNPHQMISA